MVAFVEQEAADLSLLVAPSKPFSHFPDKVITHRSCLEKER